MTVRQLFNYVLCGILLCAPVTARAALITFEGEGIGTDVSTLYPGITFSSTTSGGGGPKVGGMGGPALEGWAYNPVSSQSDPDTLVAGEGTGNGTRFITDVIGIKGASVNLTVTFAVPVAALSFDLFDIDGYQAFLDQSAGSTVENYTIQIFNTANTVIDTITVAAGVTLSGVPTGVDTYGKLVGDGVVSRFGFARTTNDIKKLVVTGSRASAGFGLGFDNFNTDAFSPSIGLAKAVNGSVTANADNTATVTFRLVVKNLGTDPLNNVSVTDLLSGVSPKFGATYVAGGAGAVLSAGQYTIQSAPAFSGVCTNGTATAAFTGTGATQTVATITSLAVQASCTVDFSLRFRPSGPTPVGGFLNQATAIGTDSVSGQGTSDLSDNGSVPDTNGNGNANETGENDPTPVFVQQADLLISKSDGVTSVAAGGSTVYTLTVTNNGPSEVTAATITDTAPTGLTIGAWTCAVTTAGSGGSVTTACGAAGGSGNLNTTVNLKNGAVITYPVNATVAGNASGNLVNPATVTPPPGTTNPGPSCVTSGGIIRSFNAGTGTCTSTDTNTTTPTADLLISKSDGVTSVAAGGSTVYTLTVTNNGPSEVTAAAITDTAPTGLTIGAWTCAVTTAGSGGSVTTACGAASGSGNLNTTVNLKNGAVITYTVNATVAGNASGNLVNPATVTPPPGTTNPGPSCVTNGGIIRSFNAGTGTCTSTDTNTVTVGVLASVSGEVWIDVDHDRVRDPGELPKAGLQVEVVNGLGVVIGTATSGNDGQYTVTGLAPSTAGDPTTYYRIRFRDPISGVLYGAPVSQDAVAARNGTISNGEITTLQLQPGVNTTNQSLPLDPSGVIYDSSTRVTLAGARVRLLDAVGNVVDTTCLAGGVNTQQTTASGYYQFLLMNPAPPLCQGSGVYRIEVFQSPTGYLTAPSSVIAPTVGVYTPPAGGTDPIQPQSGAPQIGPPADPTTYYLQFNLTLGVSADVVNNHIPLDPFSSGDFLVTKTTPLINVAKGDLVPYVLTFTNRHTVAIPNIDLRDQVPPGFKYKSGSATLGGCAGTPVQVASEPAQSGRLLTWANQSFVGSECKRVRMMLVVGSGVSEGQYTNQAWAWHNVVNSTVSNTATATVRIVPDPTFDCSDLIGKVFDDQNANGYQDEGEPGIANVRIATARGLLVTTDKDGRFHVACADIPQAQRGSNFIMKLDERSLPSGYRITTENPREVRTTRGKMVKLNFGAAIHRVVRLELSDAAFLAGKPDAAAALAGALDKLPETLRAKPSVVRLAYQAGKEDGALASARLRAVRERLEELWKAQGCCYTLVFEEEIFERAATQKGSAK
ncbi:MAG: hypothetical protein Q8Q28_01075 [Pseudomonadota bacterium]|nr:hypothetical protein [Pseudomonadota bacterium]